MSFKSMKFRIKDEEHSAKVQEALFKLGCLWNREDSPGVENTLWPFLFVDEDGWMDYAGIESESYFNAHESTQYFLAQDGTFKEHTLANLLNDRIAGTISVYEKPRENPPCKPFIRTRGFVIAERMKELAEGIACHLEVHETPVPEDWLVELIEMNIDLKREVEND